MIYSKTSVSCSNSSIMSPVVECIWNTAELAPSGFCVTSSQIDTICRLDLLIGWLVHSSNIRTQKLYTLSLIYMKCVLFMWILFSGKLFCQVAPNKSPVSYDSRLNELKPSGILSGTLLDRCVNGKGCKRLSGSILYCTTKVVLMWKTYWKTLCVDQ